MVLPELQNPVFEIFDPLVVKMGLSWYFPLLYGMAGIIVALAGSYCVYRRFMARLAFWVCAAMLSCLAIHYWALWSIVIEAQHAGIQFGPHFLFVHAEGGMCLLAWVVLIGRIWG